MSSSQMLIDHSTGRPDSRAERGAYGAVLSDRDFNALSRFIYSVCGIKMPIAKKTMLEGRLRKRLHILGIESFGKYCDFLFSSEGSHSECIHMIDVVTTNKTDFFREPAHFDYLLNKVLPELVDEYGLGFRSTFNLWSAGCSTGEEAYTLAMVLNEYAERRKGFRFSILATDISTRVLEKAKRAVYDDERVTPVSMPLRKKYVMRSKDKSRGLVRIVPELRAQVEFRRLNFMDEDYGLREFLSVIFCRNVMIYFDRPTQETVLNRFCRYLVPGGYLFTGHSETLQNFEVPLAPVATTVYRRV